MHKRYYTLPVSHAGIWQLSKVLASLGVARPRMLKKEISLWAESNTNDYKKPRVPGGFYYEHLDPLEQIECKGLVFQRHQIYELFNDLDPYPVITSPDGVRFLCELISTGLFEHASCPCVMNKELQEYHDKKWSFIKDEPDLMPGYWVGKLQ
jgi:hypothetical protein